MARPRYTHGIFKLKPKVDGKYVPPGEAIERFTNNKDGQAKLSQLRQIETAEGRDPYAYVLLPLGARSEGLLPPGV